MRVNSVIKVMLFSVGSIAGLLNLAVAQTTTPWPRQIQLNEATGVIYQPQVDAWDGNQIQARAAVAIIQKGSTAKIFGSISATARTEVDRAARLVFFKDLVITQSNFPSLADKGAAYSAELQTKLASNTQAISLDRVETSLKTAGVPPPALPIKNDPPKIILSYSPAILVPIDGAPVIKPVPEDSRFKRVINTRALILQDGRSSDFYIHVYDGWLTSASIEGPWKKARRAPFGMDDLAKELAASRTVDILDGGPNTKPKLSLDQGVPTLYVTQTPAELIVFKGQPAFVPLVGTLLWASNTNADVFVDSTTNDCYLLISGRWFRSPGANGPWSFVASNALPLDFSSIPHNSPAAVVLASVAGTPQAQEAVIANSIPQTATVPLVNGPSFVPTFDGAPQYQSIEGTPLAYTVNSQVPVIQVDSNDYYAVQSGVWFTAPTLSGPWRVATAVPTVIYSIPVSSALHYLTYVRVYNATQQVAYVGYTPGYMGTVVGPYGTVVYGTGYYYTPWVGSVWYAPPYTYGVAAVPVYNAAVGFSYGFAVGLATAAWATPYYGAAYHPYACCGSASASVYGQYGNTAFAGTKTAYAGGGQAGVSNSGSYANNRTGVSGNYSTNRNYNANTGIASQTASRTGSTAAGGYGSGSAERSYNTETGQRTASSSGSATGADGSSIEHSGATSFGPQGYDHTGSTTTTNARTGETKSWGSSPPSDSRFSGFSGGGGFSRGGFDGGFSRGGDEGGFSRGGGFRGRR